MARSPGQCMTMGTASTMTAAAESLGLTLPGASSIPAVDSAHHRMAAASGSRIVDMVARGPEDVGDRSTGGPSWTPSRSCSPSAAPPTPSSTSSPWRDAAGGAEPGRLRPPVPVHPVLANIRPGGEYLMEDFYYAGGLPALMAQIKDLLHLERMTVNGTDARREHRPGAPSTTSDVIRTRDNPLSAHGGLAILRGNLAPDGAVIKHLAAITASLVPHRAGGRLRGLPDMQRRVNDPELDVSADSVLVLRHAGPARAARACPSTACSRYRTSSSAKVSGTWSASPTPG